jgi:hypothetical protein
MMKLLLISILLFFVALVHGQDDDVNANMNCDINLFDGYMFVGYKIDAFTDPKKIVCWGCRDNASQQYEILGSSCTCSGSKALEKCNIWEPWKEKEPIMTSNPPPPPATTTNSQPVPATTAGDVPPSSCMRHFAHAAIALVTVASIILL